jgi:hypothetical protein
MAQAELPDIEQILNFVELCRDEHIAPYPVGTRVISECTDLSMDRVRFGVEQPTPSTPTAATGATNKNAPADGQGVTNDPTHLSHMTRLITRMELRGLEPLTCSLRRLRLAEECRCERISPLGCMVVMSMMLRSTPGGTHGRIDNRALASGEVVARWMCTGCQHTCRQVATTREPRAQQPIPAAA